MAQAHRHNAQEVKVAEKKAPKGEGATHINTGGAPYIGGSVKAGRDVVTRNQLNIIGDGNVVGDHSQSTVIKQVTEGVSLEGFLQLLAELRQKLPEAGLGEDTAEIIEGDVRVVEEQAAKEKPNRAIVLSKLKSVTELLGEAGKLVAAAGTLVPLAEKAITWAQQVF
jgi:hypothetical protein